MEVVINSWFPEYIKNFESPEKSKILKACLRLIIEGKCTIAIRRPSEFLSKIHALPKNFPECRNLVSFVVRDILNDSTRCRFIDDDEVEALSDKTEDLLSVGNYASDRFLFEAANTSVDKCIVTTDARLMNQFKDSDEFRFFTPQQFLDICG